VKGTGIVSLTSRVSSPPCEITHEFLRMVVEFLTRKSLICRTIATANTQLLHDH